jgi:hypothetical protein
LFQIKRFACLFVCFVCLFVCLFLVDPISSFFLLAHFQVLYRPILLPLRKTALCPARWNRSLETTASWASTTQGWPARYGPHPDRAATSLLFSFVFACLFICLLACLLACLFAFIDFY